MITLSRFIFKLEWGAYVGPISQVRSLHIPMNDPNTGLQVSYLLEDTLGNWGVCKKRIEADAYCVDLMKGC